MQSSAHGADRESVAAAAAESSDLSLEVAKTLIEDMVEAETLNEVAGRRLTV